MYRSQSHEHSPLVYQSISNRLSRLRSGTPSYSYASVNRPSSNYTPNNNVYKNLNPSTMSAANLSIPINSHSPTNIQHKVESRVSSCYRSNLRVQQGGIFGIDLSNNIGKVAKNTGIKKYNQRQIKETLNKHNNNQRQKEVRDYDRSLEDMQRQIALGYSRRNQYDSIGNHQLRNLKIMSSPRNRDSLQQNNQNKLDLSTSIHPSVGGHSNLRRNSYNNLNSVRVNQNHSSSIKLYDYIHENQQKKQNNTNKASHTAVFKGLQPGKIYTVEELQKVL